jgi:type IV secretory pathway VirB10-like protein
MHKRKLSPAVLLSALPLLACCTLAHAQWEWKDANNVRHFSDQPPPAAVPPSRILKAPRGQMPDLRKELAEQPAAAAAAATAPAPASKARPTVAERNAAATQHRNEEAEGARKAALEAQDKAANAAACDGARGNLRVLESGMRIATTDRNGEPAFLDDTQKAAQMQRNRDMLATHCK